jgi:hypothetical protein
MPVPEFRWDEYTVDRTGPPPVGAALSPESGAARLPVVVIELPDLRGWASPLDKAEILLESAAEIEHALMVQYLYAAYSFKTSDEVDPGHSAVLDDESAGSWPRTILGVACEEMGHLMTVQNLLLVLGLPTNFEREDFPPRKDLYPFPLHLEPLTRTSLAKYVVAEAPAGAPDIDDIVAVAQGTGAPFINRVGVLYGLLGVVFARHEEVQAGATSSDPWDAMVGQLALAAYQQAPPDSWHLPDDAFAPGAAAQQAQPSDWQVGGVRVHRVTDRPSARSAIRDVGEQGEGPTSSGEQSHFERFRRIYRGHGDEPGFPAGDWTPTRDVPTDPRPTTFTRAHTRRWVELADLRYALLLGLVEHYLVAAGDDRQLLTAWIFAEMRSRLAVLARKLTTLPSGSSDGGVAGMPFTLPVPIHLPGTESARWKLHEQRVQAVVDKVAELRSTDAADADDPYLDALLASDRSRLAFLAGRVTPPTATTSFIRDIAPLFRPVDVEHMSVFGVDLSDHEVVKEVAPTILQRLQGLDGPVMPPRPHRPWTTAQVDLFARWIAEGHPA